MGEAFFGLVPAIGIEEGIAKFGKVVVDLSQDALNDLLPKPYPDIFKQPFTDKQTEQDLEDNSKHRVIRLDDLFAILDDQLSENNQIKDIAVMAGTALSPIPGGPDDDPKVRIKRECIKHALSQSHALHNVKVTSRRTRKNIK